MDGSYQCETCNALDTDPSFLLENCIRLTTQKHLPSCGLYRVARGGEIKHLWGDSSSGCRNSRGRKDASCAPPDGSCKHQLVPASAQERQVQNFQACVACEWNPLECCLFPAQKYSSLQFKPWPINTCLFKNQS